MLRYIKEAKIMIKTLTKTLPRNKDSEFLAIINGNINILFQKDTIVGINDKIQSNIDIQDINILDANHLVITPGLFDSHMHGGFGCYFNDFEEKNCEKLLKELPKHGITSIFATIMTDSDEKIANAIKKLKKVTKIPTQKTKIEGIHLEGPYISKDFAGIHPKNHIISPSVEHFKQFEDNFIKMVTFAPELDPNGTFKNYLKKRKITPSAGHSGAKANEIEGVQLVTHLFNAMPKLHHRNLNLLSQALYKNNISVEVIADCAHIAPEILEIIFKLKTKDKILLISDCLPITGCDEGEFIFGGQKIHIKDKKAINPDGTMAGSIMFLDEIGQNLIKKGIISFEDFIQMASITPRIFHGLPHKIEIGEKIDLVLWEKATPKFSIIDGKLC